MSLSFCLWSVYIHILCCHFVRENPLGLKGTMAKRYAELIRDLWSGKYKSIVPLKFRVSPVLDLYICVKICTVKS